MLHAFRYSRSRHLLVLLTLGLSGAWAQDAPAPDSALGAKIYAENCSRCHAIPDPASHSRREWNAIGLHMRVFADISHDEEVRLVAFLRAVNTASRQHAAGSPASR